MKTVFWFSLCILGWGLGAFLMAYLGRAMSLGTALVCNLIGYTLAIAVLSRDVNLAWTWNHSWAVAVGILFVVANYAYYRLSYAGEEVTILAPLSSLYMVLPVALGVLLWQEPMTLRKGLGIMLALAALMLLSWER